MKFKKNHIIFITSFGVLLLLACSKKGTSNPGMGNSCDGVAEGTQRPCYEGPPGTESIGTCTSGISTCERGIWQACQGQVFPESEICGDNVDNDCDGEDEESCSEINCDQISLDSTFEISNTCITQNANAQSLFEVTLVDTEGSPLAGQNIRFTVGESGQLTEVDTLDNRYFVSFSPRANAGEHEVKAYVACDGNTEVTLTARPTLTIDEPAGPWTGQLVTGGCNPRMGNLKVTVVNTETQQPIEQASVLAGNAREASFQTDPMSAIVGTPGEATNLASTDENGQAHFWDLSGNFNEDSNITISANGYQTVTISQSNSSEIYVALSPIILDVPQGISWRGSFENYSNLESDGFGTAGFAVKSMNWDELLGLGVLTENHFTSTCWTPIELAENDPLAALFDEFLVFGNFVIPAQTEDANIPASNPPAQPLDILEHRFHLRTHNTRPRKIVGIEGSFNISTVIETLGNPGRYSFGDVADAIDFKKAGLISVDPSLGNQNDLSIELEQVLSRRVPCNINHVPEGASVLCMTGGDFSDTDDIKDIFALSAAFAPANSFGQANPNGVSKELNVPAMGEEQGLFSELQYRGIAIALNLDEENPGRGFSAKSVIIDRDLFSAGQEGIDATGFFNNTPITFNEGTQTFTWGTVENENSPEASYCKISIELAMMDLYDVDCSENQNTRIKGRLTKRIAIWDIFVDGNDFTEFTLPNAENHWPIMDAGQIPENSYEMITIQCFGGSTPFNFQNGNFYEAEHTASHISSNYTSVN